MSRVKAKIIYTLGILANFIVGVMLLYMLASAVRVDLTKPWHTLQQIAKNDTDLTSIDSNGNGRIDAGIIEDNLQDITNNGATTSRTINVGGLNSAGSIISAGDLNVGAGKLFVDVSTGRVGINTLNPQTTLDVNGNMRVSSLLNCNGKLYTDSNGIVRCGTDQVNDADADPTNELQNLQQVLQRGNNAGGLSITGLSSLSTGQLCLQDGCKSRWSDVGGNVQGTLTSNGYVKLPNGLIIQWGKTGRICGDMSSFHVTYPITFPHAVYSVVSTPIGTTDCGGEQDFWGVSNINNAGFDQRSRYDCCYYFYWMAIGY